MRKGAFRLFAVPGCAILAAAAPCPDPLPPEPAVSPQSAAAAPGRSRGTIVIPPRGIGGARFGTGGSDAASLTVEPAGGVLRVFGSAFGAGGCYGGLGEIPPSLPARHLAFSRTVVPLTRRHPGPDEDQGQDQG